MNKDKVNKDIFKKLTEEMLDTFIRKNHDYGNSFEKLMDLHGITAAHIRITDKHERFTSLLNKKIRVYDESLRDTLMDMANYAIMTVAWMDSLNDETKQDISQDLIDEWRKKNGHYGL